jgi:(p)ppGpp synthase/HD superfamily hydrolase
VSQENRAETMATKLAAYARRVGVVPDMLVSAYRMSIHRRMKVLQDVFHPELLHPARTALILIEDAGCTDDVLLTAGALVDSEYGGMQLSDREIREAFGDRVADLVAAVPRPGEIREGLLEELVTAPHDVGLIAVAERLDHARHLHFRDDAHWRPFFVQVADAYLPFAGRVSGPLETRLARWSGAFEKRLLSEG